MKKHICIAAICFLSLLSGFTTTAQSKVKEVGIEEVLAYMNKENDTLYIINFWATWCKPCVEELPYLERVYEENRDKKVRLILVSLDMPRHLDSQLKPFVERHELQGKVVLLNEPNENRWIPMVSPEWSGAIPATVFVNNATEINQFYEKTFSYEALNEIVRNLLTH
jgi:thiol-disulfide isomerase/thioredoxin